MHFRTFDSSVYVERRKNLIKHIKNGIIVLLGNHESPMNYRDNTYRFRQDSTFLYYFGIDVPGLAAIIDAYSGDEVIFGNELSIEDVVWTGPLPTVEEMAHDCGVNKVMPYEQISVHIRNAQKSKRNIHFLPPYRHDNLIRMSEWLSIPTSIVSEMSSLELIKGVAAQRSIKEYREIIELDKASTITANMHMAAMTYARPGMKEFEVAAQVQMEALRAGGDLSFATILTVNGETLHNHYHGNTIKEGQMILCDAGGETDMHYAGDMTRTWPVGASFTSKQKDIYQIVLDTHEAAIQMLQPGIPYKDIYLTACKNIFDGLKALGITTGNTEEAVAAGAHAMFFQCGLGHMIGLDVHDMEDLGEQYVGYDHDIVKSTQFGMKSLRLGKKLETGYVVTVEPGIYFIPTLIDLWRSQRRFTDFINYSKLEEYKDFSGIRVEETFAITEDGFKLLGKPLPKTIKDLEAIRDAL